MQLCCLGLRYFKDYANYVEIILYTSTVLFIIPFIIESLDPLYHNYKTANLTSNSQKYYTKLDSIKWNSGAISILLAWGNLLLFLKRFPSVGLYVVMFIEVLKTVLSVLFVFSIFIFAFALSFFVLFDAQDSFRNVGSSFVKTSVMMIGEFEYEAIFTGNVNKLPYRTISYFVFLMFLIIMPIVMMNLLVSCLYKHKLFMVSKENLEQVI